MRGWIAVRVEDNDQYEWIIPAALMDSGRLYRPICYDNVFAFCTAQSFALFDFEDLGSLGGAFQCDTSHWSLQSG